MKTPGPVYQLRTCDSESGFGTLNIPGWAMYNWTPGIPGPPAFGVATKESWAWFELFAAASTLLMSAQLNMSA